MLVLGACLPVVVLVFVWMNLMELGWIGWILLFLLSLALFSVFANWLTTPARFNPAGKHVLITGGSSGIGKATAVQLARLGANVTILARTPATLAEAAEEIRACCKEPQKQFVETLSVDVSNDEQVQHEIANHISRFGSVDVLIMSAGATRPTHFDEIDMATFRQLMEINYLGTVSCVKAVLPHMKQKKAGRIIFVSSMAALSPTFGYSAYASSKCALNGLAQSLSQELLSYNIWISLCYPPDTDTPMLREENTYKPEIARIISESGGLVSPDSVATRIIDGLLCYRFRIFANFDGEVLGLVTSGFNPPGTLYRVLLEMVSMPVLRAVAVFYHFNWNKLIRKHSR